MKETLQDTIVTVYRATTADTERGIRWAVPASIFGGFFTMLFLAGIIVGAHTAATGDPLQDVLTALSASRHQLWMNFADNSPFAKSIFGLIFWLYALAYTAGTLGVHLGFAVPQLGYVIEFLDPLIPAGIMVVIAFQCIRFADYYRP